MPMNVISALRVPEGLHWWNKAKRKYQEIVAAVKRMKKYKKEFAAKHSVIISTIHDLIDSLKIDNKKLFLLTF